MKQTDKENKENNDSGKILLLSLERGEVVKECQSSPKPEDIREEKRRKKTRKSGKKENQKAKEKEKQTLRCSPAQECIAH
jgi:hypothetical protein